MDNPTPTQRKSRDSATWPTEISYFLLNILINKHKDGRAGDNGLRKEVWVQVTNELNERWGTGYDWEQTRNHYRVWKSRLRSLSDLQKDSGMGWNDQECRFCAGQHRWAEMKRKEQRYWKEHPVLPIHLETLLWLGNEIATGNDAFTAAELVDDLTQGNHIPDVNADLPNFDLDIDSQSEPSEVPDQPSIYTGRSRGRPRGGSSSSQPRKKKKGNAEKLSSHLKDMTGALHTLAGAASGLDFARHVNEVVNDLPGYDTVEKKTRARLYLVHNKMEANTIISAPKEERVEMLEGYMQAAGFTL